MKKYILILIFIILSFIVSNFNNIKNTYYVKIWNNNYNLAWKESIAIQYFNKANNIESLYNIANTHYKLKEYTKSIDIYNNILKIYSINLDINIKSNIFHNLWNSYFKLWIENKIHITEKIHLLEKALTFYNKCINISSIENAKETNKNIEYTKFILKKFKKTNSEEKEKNKELLKKNQKDTLKTKKELEKDNQEKIYSKENEVENIELSNKLSKESLQSLEAKIKDLELNQNKYKKIYNKKYYDSNVNNQKNIKNW